MGVSCFTTVLASEFLTDCAARPSPLSPRTVGNYAWALAHLERACPALPPTRAQLRQVLAAPGLCAESRRDLRVRLGTIFRWAVEEGLLEANPLDQLPKHRLSKKGRKLRRVFTDVEVAAIQQAAGQSPARWLARRNVALVSLPLLTGLRVGELAALRRPHVLPDRLLVAAGKTGQRIVPLCPEGRRLLLGVGDEHYLWLSDNGGPLTIHGIQLAIRRSVMRAGLQGDKLGPHTLRHTFATNFIRDGGQVNVLQRILGHESLSVTQIYVNLAGDDVIADYLAHSPARRLLAAGLGHG